MGRFQSTAETVTAQLAGLPSGLTFNGYFAAVCGGAGANFKLRRVQLGVRTNIGGVPTSQGITVAMYRQTVRIAGTGATIGQVGKNMDPRGAASVIGGLDFTTGTAAGTTGPTLTAGSVKEFTFNTQSAYDIPFELMEEFICDQGTANGLAFVNIGATLPASHLITLDVEWEE